MKKALIFLVIYIVSFNVLADNIGSISDSEIRDNVESGVACWSYIKKDTYLYSDLTNSIIKIDGKIVKMIVNGSNPDIHKNKEMNLVVKVLDNGNIEINRNGSRVILKTKSRCGD